mmetsp:Transcript_20014/g.37214  ORF Transcript_20014/g.37214 Transcript_20014/m.37214 type:complete len:443 (+) Transcript_20014:939-2267(+)
MHHVLFVAGCMVLAVLLRRRPCIVSGAVLCVAMLAVLPEWHVVHVTLEHVIGLSAERALEAVALMGGWQHGNGAPKGIVPKIDLAGSVLRDKDWKELRRQVRVPDRLVPAEAACEADELKFWDRLGAEVAALVYDHGHARHEFKERVERRLGVPTVEVSSFETQMPQECQQGLVCWQYISLNHTNAVMLARFGEILVIGHRGTLFSSPRDLLGALRTSLVTHGAVGQQVGLHMGWAIVEEHRNLEERLPSWGQGVSHGLCAGHSKGGSRAQHLVALNVDSNILWHTRSFASPNWVQVLDETPALDPRVLSSLNIYVEGDPVFYLFELFGFTSQLAPSQALKMPPNLNAAEVALWVFRAHFLSSIAEHYLGETPKASPFHLALPIGLFRIGVLLCISSLLLFALAVLYRSAKPVTVYPVTKVMLGMAATPSDMCKKVCARTDQ